MEIRGAKELRRQVCMPKKKKEAAVAYYMILITGDIPAEPTT